jgi:hypothetical protein
LAVRGAAGDPIAGADGTTAATGQLPSEVNANLTIAPARLPGRGEAWAADMATTARRAVERPEASYGPCVEMRRPMRRKRRADRRRPALLTISRMLGDRLLRGRGENEDPIGPAKTRA